ncbi:MAG TPA: CDP-diacylglycerol--glycerol-3-phosphate 3-phosphatidyltransferase [Candidatus Dormibacteraeota bacterium]|nr:CDP-diacylglycerol--glycerol-3-phosphate 3-phosphatidyltransferase [Candidatus Dormibacteraeota bacterium]
MVNLPNALTISRLVAIPPLMLLLLAQFPYHDQLAAIVFVAFSITDTMDGQLARRTKTVSDLGKFLDPLVDKLFVLSVLIVLVQEGLVAAWVVVVIFARELLITLLRTVAASQGRAIAAAPLGKTKTVTQVAAVVLLILQRPYDWLGLPATLAVALALVLTVSSGLDYMWRWRHVLWGGVVQPPGLVAVPSGGAPGAESPVDPLARELGALLKGSGTTLAVAESCTGGLLGQLITDEPGSSAYFLGGVVAYGDQAKRELLNVPAALLARHGAVSGPVAEAMAAGVRERLRSTLAAAVTGIAGPSSDGSSKPVGLTYVAVASPSGVESREHMFSGDRWSNRRQAAGEALRMLIEAARGAASGEVKTA